MELNLNGPDALAVGDKGYNGDTEGAYVVTYVSSVGIDLRHESTGETVNKMSHRESYEQDWRWFRDADRATTTMVAQAISMVVDESQEGLGSLEVGLFLGDSDSLRVTEVSAELRNHEGDERSLGYPYSTFTVQTSDGQTFEVRVRATA